MLPSFCIISPAAPGDSAGFMIYKVCTTTTGKSCTFRMTNQLARGVNTFSDTDKLTHEKYKVGVRVFPLRSPLQHDHGIVNGDQVH